MGRRMATGCQCCHQGGACSSLMLRAVGWQGHWSCCQCHVQPMPLIPHCDGLLHCGRCQQQQAGGCLLSHWCDSGS